MKKSFKNLNKAQKEVLYIDTLENAIDSLETIIQFFNREDNLKWKWIVLSLHHALYSFCILNLEGSNYHDVLSYGNSDDENILFKRDSEKWKRSKIIKRGNQGGYVIEWEKIEGEPPINKKQKKKKEKLIGFWTALARVQDKELWMGRFTDSKPITISDEEWESIEYLNYFRNKLTHYIPIIMGADVEEIKNHCKKIINPIKSLALETHQVPYFEMSGIERVKKALNKIENLLKD
jgi:hypothetical protein